MFLQKFAKKVVTNGFQKLMLYRISRTRTKKNVDPVVFALSQEDFEEVLVLSQFVLSQEDRTGTRKIISQNNRAALQYLEKLVFRERIDVIIFSE